MINRLLILFALLAASGSASAASERLGTSERLAVGRTLSRIVAREVSGGYVRVQGVQASRSRVRIYASIGLSYYPFREENTAAMRDSVRALLPAAYRKARIELYTDGHEVAELIPLAHRDPEQLRKQSIPCSHSFRSGPAS